MIRQLSVVAVLLLGATRVGAQEPAPPPDRIVSGVVFDSVSGQPVSNATLYLHGRRDEFFADSYGRFRIAGIHPQDTLLVVRRIGYVPSRVRVTPPAGGLAVDVGAVRMRAVATRLDQIQVEAEEVNRYPQLADFYHRKQANRPGTFVTRDDIQKTGARKTSEMLRRTAKIEMDCQAQLLGSDQCIARARRGRQVQRMFGDAARGRQLAQNAGDIVDTTEIVASMDRCPMEVYVDGMRSTLGVDEIPLSWIAGMEIYTGLAQTPPQFGHGSCGVVAIWTTRAGG